MRGKRVAHVVGFRPGEYGNLTPAGLVRNIKVSDVQVEDLAGENMGNLFYLKALTKDAVQAPNPADRPSMVMENIRISDVLVTGRFKASDGNFHSYLSASEGCTLRGVEFDGIKYVDPYEAAPNGPAAPGFPLGRITNKHHAGLMEDITWRSMVWDGVPDAARVLFEAIGTIGTLRMIDPTILRPRGTTVSLWDVRRGTWVLRELPVTV
jgi:hypothetical protein